MLAIKQTLYRVGKNSPVVNTLMEARENGKQVAVLVELKARFDEESNIGWARILEKEGVHVIYGLLGLKTHSKVALIVRKEGEHIRRYVHLGTGNYNTITALTYEDIGMFTCDEDIGADSTDLFNYLTGYSAKEQYRKLLVAPINLREKMEFLIEREIHHQVKNGNGRLIFKMNSLVDQHDSLPVLATFGTLTARWVFRAPGTAVTADTRAEAPPQARGWREARHWRKI